MKKIAPVDNNPDAKEVVVPKEFKDKMADQTCYKMVHPLSENVKIKDV